MSKIGEKNHEVLGFIKCKEGRYERGLAWCKEAEIKIFSLEKRKVDVFFDLCNFNDKFEYDEDFEEEAKKDIQYAIESYDIFLNSIEEFEEELFRHYTQELRPILIEEEGIEYANEVLPYVGEMKDLYRLIQHVEVRAFADSVAILLECSWKKDGLAIQKEFEFNEVELLEIEEIRPVEMNYD